MLIRHRVAIGLLLLAPAAAMAQRGGGGGGGGGGSRGMGGLNGPQEPTDAQVGAVNTKDVDKLDPITIMLDKKKDLKLTDSLVKVFKTWEQTLRDTNKVRFKIIDSLNKQLHAKNWQSPTDDDRVRAENARHSLDIVTNEIRARYDSAQAKAFKLLTLEQQSTANEAIQKLTDEIQTSEAEAMRSSSFGMSGGGGGGRGGRGGGGSSAASGGTGVFGITTRPPVVSSSDLQRINPVTIVLSKKTELALADSLVPLLESINRTLVSRVEPSLKVVDSLNAAARPALGTARPSSANPAVDSVVTWIRAQYDIGQAKVFALLTPGQASQAGVFIEQTKKTILSFNPRGGGL